MDLSDLQAADALKAKLAKRKSEAAAAAAAAAVQLDTTADLPGGASSSSSSCAAGASAIREDHLFDAIHKVRSMKPGLVAKEVYAELQAMGDDPVLASASLSEVKRMCSKVAKADVELLTSPHLQRLRSARNPKEMVKQLEREAHQHPVSRDPQALKVDRPGLPTHGTTLQRGDRLGTAAERGDTQQVLKLLKKGVDPNYQNGASGVTPMGVACERGHVGVVRALLDAKGDPEISTREGYRPVHIATQFGKHEVLELLLRRGKADPLARCSLQDGFPLLIAVNFNFMPCVRALLSAGVDVHMRQESRGLTALHYAYSPEVVCALVGLGADVNDCNNPDGASPLHMACSSGVVEVCLALLACGADPERERHDGRLCVESAIDIGGASLDCANAILGYFELGPELVRRFRRLLALHGPRMEGTPTSLTLVSDAGQGTFVPGSGEPRESATVEELVEETAAEEAVDDGTALVVAAANTSKWDPAEAERLAGIRTKGGITKEQHLLARYHSVPREEALAAGRRKLDSMLAASSALGGEEEVRSEHKLLRTTDSKAAGTDGRAKAEDDKRQELLTKVKAEVASAGEGYTEAEEEEWARLAAEI